MERIITDAEIANMSLSKRIELADKMVQPVRGRPPMPLMPKKKYKIDHELVLEEIKKCYGIVEDQFAEDSWPENIINAIELAYVLGHRGPPRVFGDKEEETGEIIHGVNCDCEDSCLEDTCPKCGWCESINCFYSRCPECNALMMQGE